MYPTLNDKTTRRFPYYFSPRMIRHHLSRGETSRRIGLFMIVSFLTLAWLPLEQWNWVRNRRLHQEENHAFLSEIKNRQFELQSVDKIISSFDTGLKRQDEQKLAVAVMDLAQKYELDPYFILAVIKTESYFNHRAVSVAGARGLMQILPPVGAELAGRLNISFRHDRTLFHPTENLQMGTYYLNQLIQDFGGDVDKALLAYNMGPNFIRRASVSGQQVPTHYAERVWMNHRELLRQRERFLEQTTTQSHSRGTWANLERQWRTTPVTAWRDELARP